MESYKALDSIKAVTYKYLDFDHLVLRNHGPTGPALRGLGATAPGSTEPWPCGALALRGPGLAGPRPRGALPQGSVILRDLRALGLWVIRGPGSMEPGTRVASPLGCAILRDRRAQGLDLYPRTGSCNLV